MKNNLAAFGEKKLKEIKVWAWAASIFPISALATIFFIWMFGNQQALNIAIAIGASTMFAVAVIWWWVLHSLYSLLGIWRKTTENMEEVRADVKAIRESIKEFFSPEDK